MLGLTVRFGQVRGHPARQRQVGRGWEDGGAPCTPHPHPPAPRHQLPSGEQQAHRAGCGPRRHRAPGLSGRGEAGAEPCPLPGSARSHLTLAPAPGAGPPVLAAVGRGGARGGPGAGRAAARRGLSDARERTEAGEGRRVVGLWLPHFRGGAQPSPADRNLSSSLGLWVWF